MTAPKVKGKLAVICMEQQSRRQLSSFEVLLSLCISVRAAAAAGIASASYIFYFSLGQMIFLVQHRINLQ